MRGREETPRMCVRCSSSPVQNRASVGDEVADGNLPDVLCTSCLMQPDSADRIETYVRSARAQRNAVLFGDARLPHESSYDAHLAQARTKHGSGFDPYQSTPMHSQSKNRVFYDDAGLPVEFCRSCHSQVQAPIAQKKGPPLCPHCLKPMDSDYGL